MKSKRFSKDDQIQIKGNELSTTQILNKLLPIIASLKNGDDDPSEVIEEMFGNQVDKVLKDKIANAILQIKQLKEKYSSDQIDYEKYLKDCISQIISIVVVLAPANVKPYLMIFKKNIIKQIIKATNDSNHLMVTSNRPNTLDYGSEPLAMIDKNDHQSNSVQNKYIRRD